MLTPEDIELMSRTYREEIAPMREVPVILVREVTTAGDPFQGEGGTEEVDDITETPLVWTEVKSITEAGLTSVVDGVKIEKDDVIATAKDGTDLADAVKVNRGGAVYRIMTSNNVGIGDPFRVEMLLRKVT
jgi:hypothetical protein